MHCRSCLFAVVLIVVFAQPAVAQTPHSASVRARAETWASYTQFNGPPFSDHDLVANTDFLSESTVFNRPLTASAGASSFAPQVGIASAASEIEVAIRPNRIDLLKSDEYQWSTAATFPSYVTTYGAGVSVDGIDWEEHPYHFDFHYYFHLDAPTAVSFALQADYTIANSVHMHDFNTWVVVNNTWYELAPQVGDPLAGRIELVVRDIPLLATIDSETASISVVNWTNFGGGGFGTSSKDIQGVFIFGGLSESDPLLPDLMQDASFIFTDVISGLWYDPIAAYGYEFEMLSDSLFTQIDALPSFLVNPVTVVAGDTVLGEFHAGDSVDFSSLGGVASFRILGIDPTVDGEDPLAFPIQLSFSNAIASFSMTPLVVPEPSSGALAACGGLGVLLAASRRRRYSQVLRSRLPL